MSDKTIIKTVSGDANLPTASAKAVFFIHLPEQGKELPLGIACKTSDLISSVQPRPFWANAVDGYPSDIGGKITKIDYLVNDGALIKLFIRRSGSFSKLPITASMFIRVRKSADLRRLDFDMVKDDRCFTQCATIEGNFDIVTLEEALALGAKVLPRYRNSFAPRTLQPIMKETIIEKSHVTSKIVKVGNTAMVETKTSRKRKVRKY